MLGSEGVEADLSVLLSADLVPGRAVSSVLWRRADRELDVVVLKQNAEQVADVGRIEHLGELGSRTPATRRQGRAPGGREKGLRLDVEEVLGEAGNLVRMDAWRKSGGSAQSDLVHKPMLSSTRETHRPCPGSQSRGRGA